MYVHYQSNFQTSALGCLSKQLYGDETGQIKYQQKAFDYSVENYVTQPSCIPRCHPLNSRAFLFPHRVLATIWFGLTPIIYSHSFERIPMTFRRALPLVAALSLVFNSLLTASAQLAGLQLEQHSISAVSGGLKLTFSFNQTVEAYSLSELMLTPYNKAGEPDFGAQVPVQKPLSGKKLEFMFPSSKLVNVSAVEYRLLVKDGGGAQVYQSSLLKLDAGYLSDYAQKLTQIEQLNSRLKAATDDASRKQELLDSYGKVQADQIEFQGVSFVTDSKIVLSYKLNAPGAIKVKLTS